MLKTLFLAIALTTFILVAFATSASAQRFNGNGGADPGKLFTMISKGNDHIVIRDMGMLRKPLEEYAKNNNIRTGKLNKAQFIAFTGYMKAKIESGGTAPTDRSKNDRNDRDNDRKGRENETPEQRLQRYSDRTFERLDDNHDDQLNKDELKRSRLLEDFQKYDKNRNGLINQREYLGYYTARYGSRFLKNKDSDGATVLRIILEDEIYQKPKVYRVGQLPDDLDWFEEMDTHVVDGQLELYEWRQAEESIADFLKMDRNDDGYLTPREALFYKNEVESMDEAFAEYFQHGGLANYPSVSGTPEDESASSYFTEPVPGVSNPTESNGESSSSGRKKSWFGKYK